ncbi:DUF3558 family protein [Catellatospora tritici]|uniref:DUF3558 family protein n=1 Tax=Catellatospora tritici TaxID=2851566 RepID=UPI001C2CD739|nr:DUF3558 family protein [Catellatospora tritici]MBV1855939.1 DUF3558 domain-containing protein [Catellatospora tritici]
MRKSLLAITLLTVALAGCGPTDDPAAPAANPPAATSAAASPAPAANNAQVTPEQLCGLLSVADAVRITGFSGIAKATASWSDNVAVCDYEQADGIGKMIIQFQPNARTMFDMTKARGQRVSGLGQEAVYFDTSGQLTVRLTEADLFHVFMLDVRAHGGDPKGGAIAIANIVVPHLPGA